MSKETLKEKKFEESMERLEEIVSELEAGNLSLDESLKLYEEGIRTSQACAKRLSEAQKKIEVLVRSSSSDVKCEEADPETLKPKKKK